jgi:hypothetical protein
VPIVWLLASATARTAKICPIPYFRC